MSAAQEIITSAEVADIKAKRVSLVEKFAGKYGLDPRKMMATLKATAFKGDVSDEQMAALLVVADAHNLNPWLKEIYAFPSRNGIVPMVSVDGWARIINEHPSFDGMEFEQDDEKCTCKMYRKDRTHPVAVTEYLAECRRGTDPWNTHPKRMLRHKAMIQCARVAFSFAGIYDPDEAERIVAAEEVDVTPPKPELKVLEDGKVEYQNADGSKFEKPKKVGPVKLRKIIEGLLAAVAAKDGKALWAIVNENEMTKDIDTARHIWSELRSWESRAIHELMDATKQYKDGLDIGAWAVGALQGADTADALLATWRLVQDAYAENDVEVPADVETVFQDRKQTLAVP